jgi:hypothetical protein
MNSMNQKLLKALKTLHRQATHSDIAFGPANICTRAAIDEAERQPGGSTEATRMALLRATMQTAYDDIEALLDAEDSGITSDTGADLEGIQVKIARALFDDERLSKTQAGETAGQS